MSFSFTSKLCICMQLRHLHTLNFDHYPLFSSARCKLQVQTLRNCEEKISDADFTSSHVLKDHCMACSKRCRSILSNCSDPKLATWFQGLRKSNLPEYRRLMKEHSAAIPQTGRGVRAKWDLLEHLAGTITKHLRMFFFPRC